MSETVNVKKSWVIAGGAVLAALLVGAIVAVGFFLGRGGMPAGEKTLNKIPARGKAYVTQAPYTYTNTVTGEDVSGLYTGNVVKGLPEDENGTFEGDNGSKYVGGWKNGLRNGQGTATSSKGDKYVGNFENGTPNGHGTYTWADGKKYVGDYKDGKRNGQGTYTLADGREHVGEWKDDKRNGQGTMTWPDGAKYVGSWRDDDYNGQGAFTYPDGWKYVGEWKDGMLNGYAVEYDPDGKITYQGQWVDDKKVD